MKKIISAFLFFIAFALNAQQKNFVQIDAKSKYVLNVMVLDSVIYNTEEKAIKFLNSIYGNEYLFKECFYNKKPFYPSSYNKCFYDIALNCFVSQKPEGNYIYNSKECKWELIK